VGPKIPGIENGSPLCLDQEGHAVEARMIDRW
jgi:hypothetical protein